MKLIDADALMEAIEIRMKSKEDDFKVVSELMAMNRYIAQVSPVKKQDDEWIPVEERLPEENGLISDKVLIAQGVHDKQISFGWLRNGIWVTSDMVPFVRQELITHWMPLPDKPVN